MHIEGSSSVTGDSRPVKKAFQVGSCTKSAVKLMAGLAWYFLKKGSKHVLMSSRLFSGKM